MVRHEQKRHIVLGVVPVRRDMFPSAPAKALKPKIMKRLGEIADRLEDITLVDIDDIVTDGILWDLNDCDKVIRKLIGAGVDAVMFPHCNFGQEEVVAKVAKEIGKPVLVWGPRDPNPETDATKSGPRDFDTQCGMFATSKALNRYGVKFTYIENCWLDSDVLDRGFEDFIRVVSVVKVFHGMRVAQIGTRPRQFLSVKVNESELLRKFGIEIVPIWPEEVVNYAKKLERGIPASPMRAELFPPSDNVGEGRPDPRIAEIEKEIKDKVDLSQATEQQVHNIALVELAILDLCTNLKCDAVAVECWAFTATHFHIPSCFVLGELFDRGLPAACETDIHAAIGALMIEAAGRYASPAFIADLTIRDPLDNDAELLWHCGPFAKSLVKDGVKPAICEGKGKFEIKHGPITVVRFDQDDGNYKILADEGEGIDGPKTNGNYVWLKVNDWVKWEKKLMYGPYIHHVSGVHGQYARIIKEACKYIQGLEHDSVSEIPEL